MRLFRDKELETRLDRMESIITEQNNRIDKLMKKLTKNKKEDVDNAERIRMEKIDKSFQKLFNYNEDIATRGYAK